MPCFSIYLIKCTFLINSLDTINRFGFVHIGRVGSAFATVTVAVERFIAVMYPLKKLRNTKILLSGYQTAINRSTVTVTVAKADPTLPI